MTGDSLARRAASLRRSGKEVVARLIGQRYHVEELAIRLRRVKRAPTAFPQSWGDRSRA